MEDNEDWDGEADTKMNPARPCAQFFAPGIIKSVTCDGQNTEYSEQERAISAISPCPPGKLDVAG